MIQGRTQRVDIRRGLELAHVAVASLLQRSIALADAHGRRTGLLARLVVVLGDTEINQHRLALGVQQDVGRLYVQMDGILRMDIIQRFRNLTDVLLRYCFRQRLLLLYLVRQRPAGQVFHDIVGGPILIEHINYTNYMRIIKGCYHPCFTDELVLELVHKIPVALRGYADGR